MKLANGRLACLAGTALSALVATDARAQGGEDSLSWFRRGNVNGDATTDISDCIAILGHLFLGNPASLACDEAADTDDSGNLLITDAIYLLNHLFLGGPPPGEPFAVCGEDPTPDTLTCLNHETCFQEETESRRDDIRRYFEDRLKRREVVATTTTESGQILDWIFPESQTSTRILSAPPDQIGSMDRPAGANDPNLVDPPVKGDQPDLGGLTEVQSQPNARGPKGTVPVVRFDVESYLQTIEIPPKDPRRLLKKLPPPSPESNDRYYAVWSRSGTFYGTTGRINIWDTSGPVNNETSIAQTAVIRGSPMQTVEAGKIEHQGLNGDLRPHFFTWFTTDGHVTQADWIGGYNTLVDGWIQYSSSVAPGMSLVPWDSTENGNQYSLEVQARLWQGNWWVWAAGEWAGYYPYCSGGDAPPCNRGTLFSTLGIRDEAERLDWYGEVFDSSAPKPTSTDMGSGDFAVDWWQHAAYFRNLTFFWAPNTHWWWDSGSLGVTDSACYSGYGPFYSSEPAWKNWYFYGGPGKEASGCK